MSLIISYLAIILFMIEQSSIERLKTSIDIVDVISNYLELKKSGANYKANCPFHGEKTPSFVVSPQKQIFHCFGCGIGGDAIKFVMEIEKLNYPDAIEKLASQYNIPLLYTKGKSGYNDEKRVLELLEQWYKKNLTQNQSAMNYLLNRKIEQKSIERFEIGYVGSGSSVIAFLKQSQIPLPKAVDAGIIALGERGDYYARLTERIIFPIYNANGSIVGFGGRTLGNHPAKYINSPQTKLFNKSRLLYGYNLAKRDIYDKKRVIVTEGYLDVIMLHQAGFTTAVATLGTALTSEHLPILKKGEPKVILAYDGDKAGVAAALKAAKLLSANGFEGNVVLFPEGKDPADMVANGDLEQLKKLLESGKDLAPFVIEQIKTSYDINNPYQKQKAIAETNSYLNSLKPIVREAYAAEAARIFGTAAAYFKAKRTPQEQNSAAPKMQKDPAWEAVLKTLINSEGLIDDILNVIDFSFAKSYEDAFRNLAAGNLEHPVLRGLQVDESVPVLSEEELKKQIIQELEIYYKKRLKELMADKNLTYSKKSYLIRKIKTDILPRLKKGEMVGVFEFEV